MYAYIQLDIFTYSEWGKSRLVSNLEYTVNVKVTLVHYRVEKENFSVMIVPA